MTSSPFMQSMAIIALLWAPLQVLAQTAESDALDPATNKADAVCVTDTWALWHTQELIEETRGHVAQSFVHRFYRQRLSESKVSLAITLRDRSVPMLANVTRDGTVLLWKRGNLSYYQPNGTTKAYPEPLPIVAIYPDGVLLHDTLGTDADVGPVFYVPLRDGELDMPKKVEIIPKPAGLVLRPTFPRVYKLDPALSLFRHVLPLRHADLLVWIGETGLEVFNLHNGKRSQTPLRGEKLPRGGMHGPAPFQPLTAYDGETAVSRIGIFDTRTGEFKRLPVQRLSNRSVFSPVVLAVRHRIGYCFAYGHLVAVDLTASTASSRQLIEARPPIAETEHGLIVRSGTKWVTVPWLTKW